MRALNVWRETDMWSMGQSTPCICQEIDSRRRCGPSVMSGKAYAVNKLVCEANFIILIALDRNFPWSVPVMQ